jgi:TIR domain
LYDDLAREFGEQSVFMDVAVIEPGRDFRDQIRKSLDNCGVFLAVIGANWTDARNEAGKRRLEDPADFVRLETATALKRGDIPVIPVLVRGAKMPQVEALPEDLHNLAYRNAVELTHARWSSDLQLLIRALHPLVDVPATKGPEPASEPTPTPRPVPPQPAPEPMPPTPRSGLLNLVAAVVALLIVVSVGYYIFNPAKVTVPDARRTQSGGGPAPGSCIQGFVWRLASPRDHVCVSPNVRSQTALDNSQAAERRAGSGPYGADTCKQGYVWRDAFPDDHVCVPPESRSQAQADNAAAPTRIASP